MRRRAGTHRAEHCGAEWAPVQQRITSCCAAPGHEREHYLTTPDVNPAFRRGGLISFFRKQRASRPV